MHFRIASLAVGLLLAAQPICAAELCGDAPLLTDPALARGVTQAAQVFKISAAASKTFADLAASFYRGLAEGRPSPEAHSIAVALLHATCVELTRGQDPARLPWHVKDKLGGLATLVPDFSEAHALLERIKAAETAR
jgi:hypothetical protein